MEPKEIIKLMGYTWDEAVFVGVDKLVGEFHEVMNGLSQLDEEVFPYEYEV